MARCPFFLFIFLVAVALPLGGAPAQQAQHEKKEPPESADHSFADVAHFEKILESEDRDRWQKPDQVTLVLQLEPGMVVADVGAGTGYFARRFARAVGAAGTVFASDLQPEMIVRLRDSADQESLGNLVPVLASASDPRLPDGLVDLIFFCNTWHHIHQRIGYARRLKEDLAPGGRVAIVDFFLDAPLGPPREEKLSQEEVKKEFVQAGYWLVDQFEFLPYQYILVFSPTE